MATAEVMKSEKGGFAKGGAMGQATLTSAQGLISLLDEDDDRLRAYALKQLDAVVPDLWFEVSAAIATIEALYEDESFAERNLAALLASKVSPRRQSEGAHDAPGPSAAGSGGSDASRAKKERDARGHVVDHLLTCRP